MEYEPILHVWIHKDNDLVNLILTTKTHAPHSIVATTTSEVIHTNKKHPFFTEEKGFLPVAQLKIGMHVLRADGRYSVITSYKLVSGSAVMYNLEVQQDHTFVVGSGEWVVHNCGGDLPDGWEKLDYGLDNKVGVSDFTHIDENGNRLEATLFHDTGDLQIAWADHLGQVRDSLPGLVDYLSEGVQTIRGYVTDGLAEHFSSGESGLRAVTECSRQF